MIQKERLEKFIEQFHKQMERFTQTEKFQQSEELKKWYENSLNQSIKGFLDYEGLNSDLVKAGYPDELDYPHTTAYINALKPLPDDFIEIVISWIPKLKFKGGAVQYLREAKNKYDGRVLIPIFNEADAQGKWFLCDAIAHNPPLHINEWVKETYLDKHYSYNETGLLPLAVAKMFPRDEARAILKQGFDHHYRVTPEAFGEVGKLEDIPFLEEKLLVDYDATHVKKDIDKAIKKIKKREA
jgi:hypothetical protein